MDKVINMDDAKSRTERGKALSAALAQIEKQFGKGSIMRLADAGVEHDRGWLEAMVGEVARGRLIDHACVHVRAGQERNQDEHGRRQRHGGGGCRLTVSTRLCLHEIGM